MLTKEPVVTLSVFGGGRHRSKVAGDGTKVGAVLGEHGVEQNGQRVAVNGHTATTDTIVRPGDELTLVPRVQGG